MVGGGGLIPPAARKHLHDIRIIFHIIHRDIAHAVIRSVSVEIFDDLIYLTSGDILSASKRDLLYSTAAELIIYTDGIVIAVFEKQIIINPLEGDVFLLNPLFKFNRIGSVDIIDGIRSVTSAEYVGIITISAL